MKKKTVVPNCLRTPIPDFNCYLLTWGRDSENVDYYPKMVTNKTKKFYWTQKIYIISRLVSVFEITKKFYITPP